MDILVLTNATNAIKTLVFLAVIIDSCLLLLGIISFGSGGTFNVKLD